MKSVCFVSSNKDKIKEVKLILKNFGIEVIGKEMDIPEDKSKTQEGIATEKAVYAFKKLKIPLIVEDTGLYFEAYENFPGMNSRSVFERIGFGGVLKKLEGKSRKAYFKTVVVYCDQKRVKTFTGICKGEITKRVRGAIIPKLPYDNIFIPEGDNRTFSEMSKEEKSRFSHRAKALENFVNWFKAQ